MSMTYTRLTLGFLVITCSAGPAIAAKKEGKDTSDKAARERSATKEAKEREAKKACLNRDPDKGVELLTDLFVDSNDPTYIFNQGRCYEQNDRCADAIVRFREYLRKTVGGNQGDRADAEKHIVDCETLLKSRSGETAGATTAQAGSVPPQTLPVPFPAAQEPVGVTAQGWAPAAVAAPQQVSSPGSGLRVAGVTVMAAGGAALIAGLVLNLKHNSMIHDLKGDYRGEAADSAETYKTLSMAGYGAGAAGLLGGTMLYWLGWRANHAAVQPGVVAGNAGLLVTGGF